MYSRSWTWRWATLTSLACLAATQFDGLLLERKFGFLTGGFLAADHVNGAGEIAAFVAASLAADAALAGLLVAAGLWLASRVRLTPLASTALVLSLALAPFVAADVATYQLLTYLGDSFDLGLMFDLVGRNPMEFIAVAASHLRAALIGSAAIVTVATAALWTMNRARGGSFAPVPRPSTRARWLPLALLLLGLSISTAARTRSDVLDQGLRNKPSGIALAYVAELATDFDRDGYGIIRRPADPDPFNASVFPYAPEIAGNGIDEDGVGGDLPASATTYDEGPVIAPRWARRPNVILIVLESVRADAVGAVYNGTRVTPTLDALAAEGVSAPFALSHNGYTGQSRHHLLSGSVANVRGGTTLIDDFKANGYEVAYFSAQDDRFGGPEMSVGLDRADVEYDATIEPERRFTPFTTLGSLALPYTVIEEKVSSFLETRAHDRPLFMYVNFQDTHFPYHHAGLQALVSGSVVEQGDIAPDRRSDVRAMYLNAVANVDRAIGDVLATARRTLGSEPAVIVTSDHGESLFDEGFLGHGYALNDAQTRVPFIAARLPIVFRQPFGQSSLRDAIWDALTRPPDDPSAPSVVSDPDRAVFQYLGVFERPREIALTRTSGRAIYDFRSGMVSLPGRGWQRPETLQGHEALDYLNLVHLWERMILAQRRGH